MQPVPQFSRLSVCTALLAAGLWCGVAHAVDGVIEINQAKAMAGGVTPGDAPGFPVTIDTSGSYRLTSNLTLPDTATGAIEISTDNVDLDLNGFTILGPATCTATISGSFLTAVDCDPAPAGGYGILAAGQRQIGVHDGIVRGVGGPAVAIGEGRIHDISAIQNGGRGVDVSQYSIIRDVRAELNDGAGINLSGGIIDGAVVTRSDGNGVQVGNAIVRNVYAGLNADAGIWAGQGTQVHHCVITKNHTSGIATNGLSLFTGNEIRQNQQWGISGDDSFASGYGGNFIWDNDSGSVTGTAMIEIQTNVCGNDTDCSNDGP
jgi:hypothetical protein